MDISIKDGSIFLPVLDALAPNGSSENSFPVTESNPFAIPYNSVLCLDPLIRRIEQLVDSTHAGEAFLAQEVMQRVAKAPLLRQPMIDMELFESHRESADLMMLFLFPAGLRNEKLFKISLPFHLDAIYTSEAMDRLLQMDDACYTVGKYAESTRSINLIQACTTILQRCYGREDLELRPATMLKVPDPATGMPRFYKPRMNTDFIEVQVNGELPPLDDDDYHSLLSNIYDRELWLKLLPPSKFSFHGFMFGQLLDVTEEESLSRIKHKLLKRDAVLDVSKVTELADLLRVHFNMPELQLGLTAVDYPVIHQVNHKYKIHFHLLRETVDDIIDFSFEGSIYERALKYKEVLLVEDLPSLERPTALEQQLIELGIRSIMLAPLLNKEERVIGLVELGSFKSFGLNSFQEAKFREVMGLFRTAVARSREEVDNSLEAILREQYTRLHPSVEWRFIEAAYNLLEQQSAGKEEVAPEIIGFESVFPLYGQADIVSSSRQRNEAIHADLVENLSAAREVLVRALDFLEFPLISQIIMEIDRSLAIKSEDFNNSDETRIVEFLFREVHPLIKQLHTDHLQLKGITEQYFAQLDAELNLIYRRRKDYETSVSRLNKELSSFFDARDKASQETLPHYFEKYKTDGVEYEIYAGQSLLKKRKFSEIHLRNLRLTQLIDMCEATRLVDRVTDETPLSLETAQLIFAYTSPLNIRFRMDEKRFDVDGAYNVRYEILKKRIDKATIKQGNERLTLAGTISIVYLHEKDREEYLSYLGFLRQSGYIDGQVEELTLDPLQSVQGLKAFRFKVVV